MTNPSFVKTSLLSVTSYDSAGNILGISGGSTFKFTTSPGSLTATLTNKGSDVVAENTNIEIGLTGSNEIDILGYYELRLAKWNQETQTLGLESSQIVYSVQEYDFARQGFDIPCFSAEHPDIKCIFKVAPVVSLQ